MHALAALSLLAALQVQDGPPAIDWQLDLEAARARARRAGKPLLVVFRCET
jgi:hypothetical protein